MFEGERWIEETGGFPAEHWKDRAEVFCPVFTGASNQLKPGEGFVEIRTDVEIGLVIRKQIFNGDDVL
jgi:hypothetical protein